MNMIIQSATPVERLYAYEQSLQIAERCGNPGYLWGELDNTGSVFVNCWETFVSSQNTPEFKAEFNTVLDMLRFDERYGHPLKNRATMIVYCLNHPQGKFRNGYEYAFQADTQDYSYLFRCIPAGEDNHVYIYPYRRDCLDQHMKQAEKGIRFIDLNGKGKFRSADGDMVRIITSANTNFERMARYTCFWLIYGYLGLTRYRWKRTEMNKTAANCVVCGCIICSVSVLPLGGFTLFPYGTDPFRSPAFSVFRVRLRVG